MTTRLGRHRHLERAAALRRPGRGGRAGHRAGGARLLGAVDPRRRRRRVRRRSPTCSAATTTVDDRHRHPQRLDAHAGGDGGRQHAAPHGRARATLPVRHRRSATAPFIDHVKEAGHVPEAGRDDGRLTSTASTPRRRRWPPRTGCIAALGPKMLELARDPHRRHPPVPRHAGAHRRRPAAGIGPDGLVASEQGVVLETDPTKAREIARLHLKTYLGLPNYSNNWKRQGFTDDDIADGGSDRLVDALVVWGDEAAIAARVQEHRDAGADHVCIQVLTDDPRQLPLEQWRAWRRAADVTYDFDRFLRYDELAAWLDALAAAHPDLVAVETYGRSYEGRDLWLVTVTDAATGPHDTKPAHWVDASIHAVELTGTVAACRLLQHLVDGVHVRRPGRHRGACGRARSTSCRGSTPTAPSGRSADPPRFRRSSTRPWPWADAHRWPGAPRRGRRRRRPGPADAHPRSRRGVDAAPRRRPADGARSRSTARRPARPATGMLDEGTVVDHDGFTIPTPQPTRGPRPQPQLPGRLGHRRARLRRPPAVGAGDRRPRAGHRRPPERLRLQRLPHQRRRAAAAVVDGGRLGAAARSTCGCGSSSARSAPRSPATRCTRSSRTSRGTSPTR